MPQFPKLLSLLEKDIKAWIRDERPVSKFNGQPVRWDGKSYVYKEYFEQKKIDPKIHPRYSKFYVNRRHTIAGSYVWADKKLSEFAYELAKPVHAETICWIDVLINCQFAINSGNVAELTGEVYSGCDVLILLSDAIFKRAWCLLEAANYTTKGCKIFVAGQCSYLQGQDYFATMTATVPSDERLIKDEIAKIFGANFQAKFNRAIDDAVVQVYGESLLYNGRFREAVPIFEKELEVKRRRGDGEDSIASTYVQLGRASHSLGDYAAALRYTEEALQRLVRCHGTGHADVAKTYLNMGSCVLRLGKYEEARNYYLKCLEINRLCLGEHHIATADAKWGLARVFQELSQHNQALEMFEEVLEAQVRCLGTGHVSVADTKQNIGLVYGKLGNNTKQLQLDREAHSIYLQALGPEHPKTKEIAQYI